MGVRPVCSIAPSVLAAAAMLCPPYTSPTDFCLNSSAYRALDVFVIYFFPISIVLFSK